jgi:hypothetical protein
VTLATRIGFEEYTDPLKLHQWVNKVLLQAVNPVYTVTGPEGIESSYGLGAYDHSTVRNRVAQGFDALVSTHHNEGQPVVWSDSDDPEDLEYYAEFPELRVYVVFDTAYGFRGPRNETCTDLHNSYITKMLTEFHDLTLWWQNEYTGDWFKGADGLDEFRS